MYQINFTQHAPDLTGAWDGPVWQQAETLEIGCFRPEGSDHRPQTQVRLVYNKKGLSGIFRVQDRYVRCVHNGYMAAVYKDSCVEIFLQPKPEKGYFNFEFNCGGALRCSYIVDPAREGSGFKEYYPLHAGDAGSISIYHSMPPVVDPEIEEPVVWSLAFFIPFMLIEKYAGPIGRVAGQEWRANVYKCADETSHPHWASWAPLAARNFHLPDCFDAIRFEIV